MQYSPSAVELVHRQSRSRFKSQYGARRVGFLAEVLASLHRLSKCGIYRFSRCRAVIPIVAPACIFVPTELSFAGFAHLKEVLGSPKFRVQFSYLANG